MPVPTTTGQPVVPVGGIFFTEFRLAIHGSYLLRFRKVMAAIGRFQKGDEIFYAKVVDGEIFRLQGDVFGSPSYEKKPTPLKGVKTLVPVTPSKLIAVGLNYADHARESGKPVLLSSSIPAF